ncbi:hypothetical protein CYLTODRAFT_492917 [Cylindrobasidium torrendii FP15055 ss-10]|uniref:Uncharacterized protein n=1 Tax=Cylindrobasidium torrendii FP15055 ss-10 TaxID=1314674 RepID=A0A0D7B3D4_9AGAR|nr:hypothetical protein CYLTODRAFT_492917 [Cylindrobasidium torrendii FP15055 ss-10]
MEELYTEDCISATPLSHLGTFKSFSMVKPSDKVFFRWHESACGMLPGKFDDSMKDPINTLLLDPQCLDYFSNLDMSFRPTISCLQVLYALYQFNAGCPPDARRHYSSVPMLYEASYTLQLKSKFKRTFYLRHPVSGIVTAYRYPYPKFPRFRLLTAHPVMSVIHAVFQAMTLRSSGDILAHMSQWQCLQERIDPTQPEPNHQETLDTLPKTSKKRKESQDGKHDMLRKAKRARKLVGAAVSRSEQPK